tara:strand:+ start:1029 stop:1781 length:753 start_codon:yes stop_codon:yes gene_type:complete
MKISILTICYNRVKTIEETIQSVLSQDYPNIDYILIDGASTDGTQAVIEKYQNQLTTYISEPDKGMYHAINKGLAMATGDIVGLVHSDDTFYDEKVISKMVEAFLNAPDADAVYGDGLYVTNDETQKIVRNRIGGHFSLRKLENGWLPLHPTVYIKRNVLEKYGLYDTTFKIASDTEFLLRYLYKEKIKIAYLPIYFMRMKMGGLSTSKSKAIEVLKEDYRVYKFHGLPGYAVPLKKMKTAFQYLRAKFI